ncbi:DUF4307 domain-containing protein [Corynebacterium pygosceleis]|uniref:DUF4307 domain-containing protein n=1 Tax=Corynebacterium pygosceleis TaxID=2800406 RepID=UPI002003B448|nr:DUF4307 domain-containing protein [Corynebacterium pygosceleis]
MENRSHRPPLPSDRYAVTADGSRGNLSGRIIAIGSVLFLVAAVVVTVQYFQKTAAATVSATTSGFERTEDESTLRMFVDVTRKNTDTDSYCVIQALDYDKIEVGRREFLIPPGGESTERYTVEIPTRGLPVAGKVYGCHEKVPAYLTESEPR